MGVENDFLTIESKKFIIILLDILKTILGNLQHLMDIKMK